MDWMRAHPYASAIAGACILVIVGTVLTISRSDTPAPTGISAWNGNSGASTVPNAIAAQPENDTQPVIATQSSGTQTLPYTQATTTSTPTDANASDTDSFNYDAFLAQLSQSSKSDASASASASGGGTTAGSDAWAYIPTGLISTSSGTQASRTPTQQALYAYGNELGSYIQGYDDTHGNQVQVMENALNDRQNATKAQDVAAIGTAMETIGTGIAEISNAPASVLTLNTDFANEYTDSGQKLVALSQALSGRDADLVTAIDTYDTSINTYITTYVALANIFKINNVTFSSSDPGSVFTFTASGL